MDAKRGTRQGASKTSVASRHASNANVARKYGSEVSLTPSQAKHNVDNPRKSPLDALSRHNNRQDPFQRRSGLQDVDDSFMASNAFARPSRVRHTGLDGQAAGNQQVGNAAVAPLRVASGQEPQQMQYQQQQLSPQQAAQPPVANMAASQMQLQQQQQPAAAQQQPPAAVVPSQQSLQQQQQPQQYVQPPAAGQPTRHDPYPSGRAHVQHQHHHQQQQQQQAAYEQQVAQQEAHAQAQVQAQQQQQQQQQQPPAQLSPRKQQQQQGYAGQQSTPAGGASAAPAAAEMCTTCPNCQTTIYLVRSPELGHGDGGMPMQ
ncbi:uncharacterized protein LOC133840457 [Drosophila sulfurigaster albostrigata]|uniref:uncharacterized protein LOC133840457 n=1 Tax=Drosophila sulfurigaster albostrigata TaxID=89887 RepID=UPI002D219946|nr:uncharacterized protein LOC133840457 [Drosophila sulfurigaster albostrigata]